MLQYIEVIQSTIGLQHFNILGYHRIAILQYIANYLFLQRTLTVYPNVLNAGGAGGGSSDDYGDDLASISETKRKTGKKGR